jgi:hypothetical protein
MVLRTQPKKPLFENLEPRLFLSGTVGATDLGALGTIAFVGDGDYSNGTPPTGGLFRDVVNGQSINRGLDNFGGILTALNFNNGTKGVRGLTVLDTNPTTGAATMIDGNVTLSVDFAQAGTNANLPGLVALFNEGVGKKGLALVISEAGNTDTLELHSVPQSADLTSSTRLAYVSLKDGISDGVWYRLVMDVAVANGSLTVTGQVFSHANPAGPVGAQIGPTLKYTGTLAKAGVTATGEAGLIFDVGAQTSKASFVNFTLGSATPTPPAPTPPAPTPPAPTPDPTPAPLPAPSPVPAPVSPASNYLPASVVTGSIESLASGLRLVVLGTTGADVITLSGTAGGMMLTAAWGSQIFTGAFSNLVVYGFSGDDTIRITNSVTASATVYAGDGNDTVYAAGMGSDTLYGGAGNDLLVTVGGGVDKAYGESGFDSFWVDSNIIALDTVADATADEVAAKAVHKIIFFYNLATGGTSMEIAGQNLVDPTAAYGYSNFSSKPLFVDGPEYSDIRQGAVGDCYFLASLASIAYTDPEIIRQMIAPLGDGSYAVRFITGSGSECYVRVDADLPGSGGSLAYAKITPDGELWVALVEKAFAVFRGGQNSYATIASGWMTEPNQRLAGAASDSRSTGGTPDSVAQYIQQNIQAGHAVTAATATHGYGVLGAQWVGGAWQVDLYDPYGSKYTVSMATFQQNWSALVVCLA